MRYRKFGALDWEVSVLGLSLGGLPLDAPAEEAGLGRESGTARAAEAAEAASAPEADPVRLVRLIRHALDHGVNYLDLGHPYDLAHQRRVAEVAGRALRGGYREKAKIAVTIPVPAGVATGGATCAGDFDHHLDTQLEWLGTDYADFCVFDRIDRQTWPMVKERGLLQAAERALADGRVGSLGFALHDQHRVLRQVMSEYDRWTFAQFRYSYMDVAHDPGSVGLVYAAGEGLAVVVTEPLKRGRLAKQPPAEVQEAWPSASEGRSLVEWALGFVWNQPAVATAVTAVDTMEQLVENVALADQAAAGDLTVRDELAINRVRDAYQALKPIDCSYCRPCMPCPDGIDIPRVFEIFNDAIMYDDVKTASAIYRAEGHRADLCTGCGACETRCTRRTPLPIIEWLAAAAGLLGSDLTPPSLARPALPRPSARPVPLPPPDP